jgi:ABC-type Zn uptake system ZnuABC Zn-binding protein ZnuA
MFDVNKPKQKPTAIIRSATAGELSEYQKRKLDGIEENAQENKIEMVNLSVDGAARRLEPVNKEITIDVGKLATKSTITPADVASEELFYITCDITDIITEE